MSGSARTHGNKEILGSARAHTASRADIVRGSTRAQGPWETLISALDRHGTNFFEKNVHFELAFSEMSARLNNMPDAGVAQW